MIPVLAYPRCANHLLYLLLFVAKNSLTLHISTSARLTNLSVYSVVKNDAADSLPRGCGIIWLMNGRGKIGVARCPKQALNIERVNHG